MIRLSPRFFLLPLLALVVIGSLPAPADTGNTGRVACGPGISRMADPAMRATYERFERSQSAAAAKICALYRNSREAPPPR
jgi:hypothetical protein